MKKRCLCLECGIPISDGTASFSKEVHGVSLCLRHHYWLNESTASTESVILHFILRSKNIPSKLHLRHQGKQYCLGIPGKLLIEIRRQSQIQSGNEDFSLITDGKKNVSILNVSSGSIHDPEHLTRLIEKIMDHYLSHTVTVLSKSGSTFGK